jgi:hypothetical protein
LVSVRLPARTTNADQNHQRRERPSHYVHEFSLHGSIMEHKWRPYDHFTQELARDVLLYGADTFSTGDMLTRASRVGPR